MHSLDTLENEGKDLGFNVKTSKCMLWSPQTMSSLDQNIKRADPDGFEVLGAPIGTETHHAKVLSKSLEKTEPLVDSLQQLDDPHTAYSILKICIGRNGGLYHSNSINTLADKELISKTFFPTTRHVPVKARLRWSNFISEICAKCHTSPTDI